MRAVDDQMETIHLYVVRGQEKQSYTAIPLLCAFICLVGIAAVTFYSATHPYYEQARITVPARFLPLKVLKAEARIIPTGVKMYPATYATGMLTLTNGSVLSEVLPGGVTFSTKSGVEVQTTESVFIPAGSASDYGLATVPARALANGKQGNIPAFAVDAVYGTSLFIRNLSAFNGGCDGYSVTFATTGDRQAAIDIARSLAASQKAQIVAYLAWPCGESLFGDDTEMIITLSCQYVTYKVPAYMHITAARLIGKNFLVDVAFTPLLQHMVVR